MKWQLVYYCYYALFIFFRSVRVVFREYFRGFTFWATYFLLIKKQIATYCCTLSVSVSISVCH